jgi:hypothetical protein
METSTTNGTTKARRKPTTIGDAAPGGVEEVQTPVSAKAAIVFIPKIETTRTIVEVRGISPLIVHAWGRKAKEMMRAKQQKLAQRAKEAKDPVADFNESRYINDKGEDCVPVISFKSAAVEAGIIAGAFKTTLRKAFFVGNPGEDLVPIISDGPPVMREDMVRVGQGVADMRYRAQYTNWSCKVPVEFNPRLISAEQIFNLFDNAGYSIGICEWRPEKDGQFGRFRVVLG